MGWADRESPEALAEMLLAEVRLLEADHTDVAHYLDELRIHEGSDQVGSISRERCGRLHDIAVALKAKTRP